MSQLVLAEGKALLTTSRIVAKAFGMEHKNVMLAIRNLSVAGDFARLNFKPCKFTTDKNREFDEFHITEAGAMLLIMGFTGDKALHVKLRFIAEFEAMRDKLAKMNDGIEWKAARLQGKNVRQSFTNTIKNFVDYATLQGSKSAKMYYATITRMDYQALDLLDKQKTSIGNFRDTLDILDISALLMAESVAKGAIERGMQDKMHYKEIYMFAKQKVNEYAKTISFLKIEGTAL
jgi:Rha family phage regulatory protein